jgi:hypothetical protein
MLLPGVGNCYVPVEVIEEAEQIETEFDKGFLLVRRQRAEYLGSIIHVRLL